MSELQNAFYAEQEVKLKELLADVNAYDKATYNTTTLHEWRTKWLNSFYIYMYEIQDDKGELIDPDGEVLSFWNAREMRDRLGRPHGPNIFIDTHIVDERGITVYIIPSTVTSIATTVTDVNVEPSLYAMLMYAKSNPLPNFREAEANDAIIGKYNSRIESYTEAYTKHLIINHMFVKEGYEPLINEDGTLNTQREVVYTDTPKVPGVTPAVVGNGLMVLDDFEDDDFDFGD